MIPMVIQENPGYPNDDKKNKKEIITRKQKAKDLKEEKIKNNTLKQTLGQQDVLNGEVDVLLGDAHQPWTYADDYNVQLDEHEER